MLSQAGRITILALVAAAVVALSGFPAQAQPYYYYGPPPQPYYGPQPSYGATCQTYSYNGATYSNCPQQPYYTQYYYYYGNPYGPGMDNRER